jgi:hypothetical protein
MNRKLTIASILLAGAAWSAAEAEKLKVPPYDLAADPAAQAGTYVTGKKLEALHGLKKVAIPSFQVEFTVQNVASAWSSSTDGVTSSKMKVRLSGPDKAMMQAITDRLYDRVVADLESAGLEVVPFDVVRQNEAYQKFKARHKPSPELMSTQDGKSVFFAPHGMPVYFRSNDERLNALAALGKGGFTVHPQNYEPKIADDLGAAVLRARMVIDIAKQKTGGGYFASGSSVKTQAALSIVPEYTEYMFLTPGSGTATIVLDKEVSAAEQIFEIRKPKEAVAPSLAVFGGPDDGDKVKGVYVIHAAAEDYERVVEAHLGAVHEMFLSQLRRAL